ncbi:Uncharacterised protein [Vibrio cholerae]|nr:Uncharacterised protein [Vibrio cholerae]CSI29776.1 Uncharacterised protein [Vibrio cholerae]
MVRRDRTTRFRNDHRTRLTVQVTHIAHCAHDVTRIFVQTVVHRV